MSVVGERYNMKGNGRSRVLLLAALIVAIVAAILFLAPVVQRMCVERELSAAIVEYDSARNDLDTYLTKNAKLLDKCAEEEVFRLYCDTLAADSENARVLVQAGVPTGYDPSDIDSIRGRLTALRVATAELAESHARLMEKVAQAPMGDAG